MSEFWKNTFRSKFSSEGPNAICFIHDGTELHHRDNEKIENGETLVYDSSSDVVICYPMEPIRWTGIVKLGTVIMSPQLILRLQNISAIKYLTFYITDFAGNAQKCCREVVKSGKTLTHLITHGSDPPHNLNNLNKHCLGIASGQLAPHFKYKHFNGKWNISAVITICVELSKSHFFGTKHKGIHKKLVDSLSPCVLKKFKISFPNPPKERFVGSSWALETLCCHPSSIPGVQKTLTSSLENIPKGTVADKNPFFFIYL